MCRITVNGKQPIISTKLDITSTTWDLKCDRDLGKSQEDKQGNGKIDKIRLAI